jgi:hypothetical protein
MEDAALQAVLEKLAEADIVLVQGLPPESDYRFKHALREAEDSRYLFLIEQSVHGAAATKLSVSIRSPKFAERSCQNCGDELWQV